ncbi:MAG: hypothetical protein V1847_02445 [Candidatus Diapherotrites archaeon]
MEFSPFRLLIIAIFTIALLYALAAYILPSLFQADVTKTIAEIVPIAETQNGTSVERENIAANAGTFIPARSFEKTGRVITFECLSSTLCCGPAEISCSKPLKVALKELTIVKSTQIDLSARCFLQENIYTCKVFFGGTPAQVEFSNVRAPQEMQLDQNNVLQFSVDIENAGGTDLADELQVKPQVWKTISNAGIGTEEFLANVESQNISPLRMGQKKTVSFAYKVPSMGDYHVKISASSELAGKTFAEFRVHTFGNPANECIASSKESPFIFSNLDPRFQYLYGQCVAKANCTNCTLISTDCVDAWEAKEPGTYWGVVPEYAYEILPPSLCP